MKQHLIKVSSGSAFAHENVRIYFAIAVSGIAILLMILAEMKFFGT